MVKDKRKYTDRAEYLKNAVQKRRQNIRKMALEHKGNKCFICGYNKSIKALEFHHLDPKLKDFGISSKGYTRSFKKIRNEIEKCVLLCSNCHREVHEGITQLPQVIEG